MTDMYSIEFDPSKLSYQQEELGTIFADLDTAVELMKKEEKMIVAELTIYTHEKFRDFTKRYSETLKRRNRAKIRFESFKAFRDDMRTKVVNERELAKNL